MLLSFRDVGKGSHLMAKDMVGSKQGKENEGKGGEGLTVNELSDEGGGDGARVEGASRRSRPSRGISAVRLLIDGVLNQRGGKPSLVRRGRA